MTPPFDKGGLGCSARRKKGSEEMITSDYYVKDLISSVKVETDSYQEVPQDLILMAYNALMQQLYRTVIREQGIETIERTAAAGGTNTFTIKMDEIQAATGVATPTFEDVLRVEMGAVVFSRATMATSNALKNIYYKNNIGNIAISCDSLITEAVVFEVTFTEKPKLVTTEDLELEDSPVIPVPNEFVPMVYAGVRGEAYKLANQDTLSAKWIADYNAQAETLAKWIAETKPTYGN